MIGNTFLKVNESEVTFVQQGHSNQSEEKMDLRPQQRSNVPKRYANVSVLLCKNSETYMPTLHVSRMNRRNP